MLVSTLPPLGGLFRKGIGWKDVHDASCFGIGITMIQRGQPMPVDGIGWNGFLQGRMELTEKPLYREAFGAGIGFPETVRTPATEADLKCFQ